MKNEDRLIEIMADLLAEVHEMRGDMKGLHGEIAGMRSDTNKRLDRLEGSMGKMNLQLAENSRAILKLADFGDRIIRLENTVFRKAS